MAKKPLQRMEYREVVYDSERWSQLRSFREKAQQIMQVLEAANLETIVHGSIARGDISHKSDIDAFIQSHASSFEVETALQKAGIRVNRRLVIQATPNYAMKAHVEIDEKTAISFPLMKMRRVEREFYKFGGEANIQTLKQSLRVLGVDKRLMLIEPTSEGHKESSIVGREDDVAKLLGVSVETVLDRVHTLLRRDKIGRTGVFIKQELFEDETFEMALNRLADENPAVRRRLSGPL